MHVCRVILLFQMDHDEIYDKSSLYEKMGYCRNVVMNVVMKVVMTKLNHRFSFALLWHSFHDGRLSSSCGRSSIRRLL